MAILCSGLFKGRWPARASDLTREFAVTRTTRETVIVPDVDKFPGHIACASASKSEIVVPVFGKDGEVFGVLDVDSDRLDDFSEIDVTGLGRVVKYVEAVVEHGRLQT